MSRVELIQLLLEQAKELERVRQELVKAQEIVKDRQIQIHNAGSIAEAALQINQVMEAAQKAADQYLENIQREYESRARRQYDELQVRFKKLEEATKAKYAEVQRKAEDDGTDG